MYDPTVGLFLHWELKSDSKLRRKRNGGKSFFLFLFFIQFSSQLKLDSILSWPQWLQFLLFAKFYSCPRTNEKLYRFNEKGSIFGPLQTRPFPVEIEREREREDKAQTCPFSSKSIAVEEKMKNLLFPFRSIFFSLSHVLLHELWKDRSIFNK